VSNVARILSQIAAGGPSAAVQLFHGLRRLAEAKPAQEELGQPSMG